MSLKNSPYSGIFTQALNRAGFHVEQVPEWEPYPYQIPPPGAGVAWNTWLLLGGRGAGKTEAGSRYCLAHLREFGPEARIGVGAPTYADVRDVCAEGPSGLLTMAPHEFDWNRSTATARHKNGGVVKFMSAEEPSRFRGPQFSLLWADELALWKDESWVIAQFCVRLGPIPHIIATTTPKARKLVKELAEAPTTIMTHGASHENTALAPTFYARLQERWGGTRLGRQELLGEFVDELEGSLFKSHWIDDARVQTIPMLTQYEEVNGEIEVQESVDLSRIVVAIDPAITNKATSDETGIAVAGINSENEFFVLHLEGYKLAPHQWATKALELYDYYQADRIIAETNNGGDMVIATVNRVAESQKRSVNIHSIRASKGKTLRAEPIAALYEQGRVHHVGQFKDAEDQMVSFPIANEHDDLVDAVVYALTDLAGVGSPNIRFLQ